MSSLIDDGLSKSYLKEIWSIQNKILESTFLNSHQFKKIPEIRNTIEIIFEVLNSNIHSPLNFVMFNIFKCLEYISEYYIEENKQQVACWIDTKEEIKTFYKKDKIDNNFPSEKKGDDSNNSAENKIRMIMHEKLNLTNYDDNMLIKKLVCNRNYYMHTEEDKPHCKKYIQEIISKEDILAWFKMLQTILEKIDAQPNP